MSVAIYVVGPFSLANVTPGASNVPMLLSPDSSDGFTVPYEGDLLGLVAGVNAAISAQSLTVLAAVNDVWVGATFDTILNATNQRRRTIVEHNVRRLAAGDRLTILATAHASLLPATLDLLAWLVVSAGHHQVG